MITEADITKINLHVRKLPPEVLQQLAFIINNEINRRCASQFQQLADEAKLTYVEKLSVQSCILEQRRIQLSMELSHIQNKHDLEVRKELKKTGLETLQDSVRYELCHEIAERLKSINKTLQP